MVPTTSPGSLEQWVTGVRSRWSNQRRELRISVLVGGRSVVATQSPGRRILARRMAIYD